MSQESWNEARLIPTSGITGADEQERRGTSALLAVMSAVREFGRALTRPLGAPAGAVQTYIEIPLQHGDRRLYPDGLIRVARGSKVWTALVEVKTGTNLLGAEQVENYLDIARDNGFDAVITISNEIPAVAGQHPTRIDKRKLRKVDLHHWSWTQVLAQAVMQKEFRGVADPEQAWILGELIRYLEHPRSGALEFDNMGEAWTGVRDGVGAGTLRPNTKGVEEVASRFDALLRFTSLRLGRQLGTEVTPILSRKEQADPALRTQALVTGLCDSGQLVGAIKIPDTVGPLIVTVDLRAGRIECHIDIDAPHEGRPTTRVNWLVRQLKGAPDTVRIEAFAAYARGASAAGLLGLSGRSRTTRAHRSPLCPRHRALRTAPSLPAKPELRAYVSPRLTLPYTPQQQARARADRQHVGGRVSDEVLTVQEVGRSRLWARPRSATLGRTSTDHGSARTSMAGLIAHPDLSGR